MTNRFFRIHGDNIVECERTLSILSDALSCKFSLVDSPLHKPVYSSIIGSSIFTIELLSGHDRWGISIGDIIIKNGGNLREGADSYITEILKDQEEILFALEYCSALPAGNNAWQRNGRALSSILVGVPYFYYAEIGGVELDKNRNFKAPRFPNPLVPFSYISATQDNKVFCVPVYKAHPTITEELYQSFKDVLGYETSLDVIRKLIMGINYDDSINILRLKNLKLVQKLAKARKGNNKFIGQQWSDFLNSSSKIDWIDKNIPIGWRKKASDKVDYSPSYITFLHSVERLGCKYVGSYDMPICVIPKKKMHDFKNIFVRLYPNINVTIDFERPLAIVWITGYKPKGDSRPDRGLAPLARMVLGIDAQILAVVSGPIPKITWASLRKSVNETAKLNGLWQAIVNNCNFFFIDSNTSRQQFFYDSQLNIKTNTNRVKFKFVPVPKNFVFGEHDTDTVIHLLFSSEKHNNIQECLCNPPGGDWSGIDFFGKNTIYRWTSLPRVSPVGGKRPDHLFQIGRFPNFSFWIIESKGNGIDLEDNIGNNLKLYIQDLFQFAPSCSRQHDHDWRMFKQEWRPVNYPMTSIAAFKYESEYLMKSLIQNKKLDCILAFTFSDVRTTLHVMDRTQDRAIQSYVEKIKLDFPRLIVQIH